MVLFPKPQYSSRIRKITAAVISVPIVIIIISVRVKYPKILPLRYDLAGKGGILLEWISSDSFVSCAAPISFAVSSNKIGGGSSFGKIESRIKSAVGS